jgi:hypothetical protein
MALSVELHAVQGATDVRERPGNECIQSIHGWPRIWIRTQAAGRLAAWECVLFACAVLCCIVDPSPLIPIPLHGTVSAFDVILDHVPSFFLLTIVIAADSCYMYVLH